MRALLDVILLDEPELNLHPTAVDLVAEMVKAVGRTSQVIVATQSPLFVDAFGLDQVIVLDLDEGATVLRQLVPAQYAEWLEQDYLSGRSRPPAKWSRWWKGRSGYESASTTMHRGSRCTCSATSSKGSCSRTSTGFVT